MSLHDSDRLRSAEHAVVGGGLITAGAVANHKLDQKLAGKGLKGVYESAFKLKKLRPYHAAHMAGKMGVRGLQLTGIPLAAAGIYGVAKPAPTRRVSVKSDIVRPALKNATFADAAQKGRDMFSKDGGSYSTYGFDAAQLQRKKRARVMNYTAAGLGAAALAARAPAAGKAIAGKLKLHPSHRLHGWERHVPAATKASNVLGIASLSTSAANSYNTGSMHNADIKRARIVKADRFLAQHRNRISPDAERGYLYLKRGRNEHALNSVLGGASAGFGAKAVQLGVRNFRHAGNKKALAVGALGGAIGAYGGYSAVREARTAARWNAKMGKIKAKAYERAEQGVYGRPVQKPSDVAKALMRVSPVPAGSPFPKGLLKRPSIRSGGIRHLAGGGWSTFRGSVG